MLSNKAGNISWAVTSVLVWESYPFVGKSPWFGSVSLWSLPFDGRRWCCQTEARSCVLACVCVCALHGWKVLHSLHDFTATTKAGCFTVLGHETVCFACTWVSWGLRRWKLSQAAFSWTWVNMILLRVMQAVFLSAKYAPGEYVKYWLNSKLIYTVKK